MACMLIALSSFVPMLSHAMRAHAGPVLLQHEICTASGIMTVAEQAVDEDARPHEQHAHADDCPYCRLHADHPALPPSLRTALPVPARPGAYPLLFYAAPRTPHAWAAANPRAPPRFS